MTDRELKDYREEYYQRSKLLRESSYQSLQQVKETPEEQESRIKHLLKPNNYNAMCRHWFHELCPVDCAPFHITAYKELYHNEIINQFLHGFRGSAKSTHATIMNPFALKENKKIKFFLVVGSNEANAIILLSDLQMQLESNERIIKDFGHQEVYGDWADGQFQTRDGVYFKALGLEKGKFRGLRKLANRIDHVVVDDCEDEQLADNPKLVRKRVQKITGDIGNAFQKGKRRLVIPNNYFVENGLMDGLHKKLDGPYTKTHWINLSTGDADTPGDPTWPSYFSVEDVKVIHNLHQADLNTLKKEMYNTPAVEGKVFKEEWIRYERLPKSAPEIRIGFWDLSYKKDGDYKAYAEVTVWNNKMYLTDCFVRKCEISEAVRYHYDRVIHFKKNGTGVLVYFDATAAQEEVFTPVFQQEMIRRKCATLPIPDRTSNVDKFLRIEATLVNVLFHGLLVVSEHLKDTPDWKIALSQLLAFEKSMKGHDDFPDGLENAVRKAQLFCVDRENYEGTNPLIHERELGGF